ncbi:MAG: cytidine deaminase [Clostridia bacterium]|nr:cytidine deaminase [Clostridia bacterium]
MDTKLVKMAIEARGNAYAPYSGFYVGAALLAEDGSVYTGCNIENASFGGTVCAERCALFKAVSDGKRGFKAIAVAGGKGEVALTPPCGICRQVLSEHCDPSMAVLMAKDGEGTYFKTTLGELLPLGFGAEALGTKGENHERS